MVKLFQTPDYIKKVVDELINSPEIVKAIKNEKSTGMKSEDKAVDNDDDQKIFFKLWLIDQYERYHKVKSA